MDRTEATVKSDLITLPRSESFFVEQLAALPTVVYLPAIGQLSFSTASEPGAFPGIQDTYLSAYADGSDLGYCASDALSGVTGSVASFAVTAAGSGYTSVPTVTVSASPMQGPPTISGTGSGYTAPPILTYSGGGGAGALGVGIINSAGQVVAAQLVCTGWGYTSAGAITVTSVNGLGGGATATPNLATATAIATISTASGGTVASIALSGVGPWNAGAGYGSTGAAVVTISGGGGSGATATAYAIQGAPNLSATGAGAGAAGTGAGLCKRLPNGQGSDAFARVNKDPFIGITAATSGGVVRIFRSST